MLTRIRDWIETRIGLNDLINTGLRDFRVPANLNIFHTLGFVTLTAYAVQLITGVFLLIYYIPHSGHAFGSVNDIMTRVPYGWLFRQMHQVSSNLMTAALLLHLLFIFVGGSYKKPREMTWVTGGVMFLAVLAFCLTGYLLPWNQLGYWATTVVTTMFTTLPYLGEVFAQMLRGGNHVSEITLNRFFALHVALLPLIFITFMIFHLFLIRRTGFSKPPSVQSVIEKSALTGYRREDHPDGYPFYPYFVIKAAFMVCLYFLVMFFILSFFPASLLPEDAITPADPLKTPAMIRPAWYFLAPYQMLKLIPNKALGMTFELLMLSVFLLWPFLDTREERNILKRPLLRWVFIVAFLSWLLLTVWGRY